ncbi:MAG: stage III sporulation protein AB [Ruminococcaceae bacterium]|nr:stage III sporulation protein AB [Oscillospiraceae bacterium]
MIRLVGVGLLWGGCSLWGLQAARTVRQRVRVLEDMGQAMELLERELSLNRTALPELLERLSHRNTQQGRVVFLLCRKQLEQGESFSHAWECALKEAELDREERTLLCGLSQVLGKYDVQGQTQALSHLRQELERRCMRKREEGRALVRVYRMLGITAGGFLTLTLL